MNVKRITDVVGIKVYTDSGDYFGTIEEANLGENRIDGWRIRLSGEVIPLLNGARGVIIPHQFIRAMSDICIINKNFLPSSPPVQEESEETAEDLI